jgi:hypothetical protein
MPCLSAPRFLLGAVALLALAALLHAQQPAPAGPGVPQKVIQDPAEYKAYAAAISTADSAARAQALDSFTQQYPKTVVLIDALEQEMTAWQAAGDSAQVKNTAKRLVDADPGNVRAIGIVVSIDFLSVTQDVRARRNVRPGYRRRPRRSPVAKARQPF